MSTFVVARSIAEIGDAAWNRLFPNELEDAAYYGAVERAGLDGFDWRYFALRDGDRLVAAVPAFITDYRLDTTVSGALKRVADALASRFPRLLRVPMLALGSPVGEVCHLGFDPDGTPTERARWLDELLAGVDAYAANERVGMVAIKDAPAESDALWSDSCRARRLRRLPGLPTATLAIGDSVDAYLGHLGPSTRKDLRRKLRARDEVAIEWRRDVDDVLPEIEALYRATLAHADYRFEELTPAYFTNVLSALGERASCVLYRAEGRLVAFNLVLHDAHRLLDKFLGMDYALARRYNLYYLSWMENVRYCVEHGIRVYQSGQGLHREKVRLGSTLTPNWLWYRHRNAVVDRVFAAVERIARLDRFDPDLAALIAEPRQ